MQWIVCVVSSQSDEGSVTNSAYACLSVGEGNIVHLVQALPPGSSHNAAYLDSVAAAVESASLFEDVVILTNARYVTDGLKSVSSWRAKGWRNSSGTVPNRERWERLVGLLAQKPGVRIQHLSEVSTSPELRATQSLAQALAKAAAAAACTPFRREAREAIETITVGSDDGPLF